MQKSKQNTKPTLLIILDGFGYSPETYGNAIAQAHMPHFKLWIKEYPHAIIEAAGTAVGLPAHVMGNSEVGHLTLGAGRIIEQDVVRINKAISDGSFFNTSELINSFKKLSASSKSLHLIGLLSDADVHSNINHLFAYLKAAKENGIKTVYIHGFLDGRDVGIHTAKHYLSMLDKKMNDLGIGKLASLIGRFYAMDRDHNWERTQKAYNLLTQKEPVQFNSWQEALAFYYKDPTMTDEYIPPISLDQQGIIQNGDGIIFFNFRPDRARQLTAAFTQPGFTQFETKSVQLAFFITPTDYDAQQFKTIVLFKPLSIEHTLKEVLNNHHMSMFSIAETEKYAHVTYFFGAGKEKPFPNEEWVIIPSIKSRNYVNYPCMSAPEITKAVIKSLETNPKDFYLINYANADMVGHSGNLEATIQAVECLDKELAQLYKIVVEQLNGTMYVTADHGNAEEMIDLKTGLPKTSHTTNPVPFIMINKELKGNNQTLSLQGLSDVTPFILKQMHIQIPKEMHQQ